MLKALKVILEIQELDMKMIRLMDLKRKRQAELDDITSIKKDLSHQVMLKEGEIIELKKNIRVGEGEIEEIKAKIKDLESKQNVIKKVEEFNALSHEISSAERERVAKERRMSDLYDNLANEEDILKNLKESLTATQENSQVIEEEIIDNISLINAEGREIKEARDKLAVKADPEVMSVYERLLRNKKDRVVVSVENRCCSGCHITLTAQHENVVRKGEKLVFCEHCSRIHYWQESKVIEETTVAPKRRRRRSASA